MSGSFKSMCVTLRRKGHTLSEIADLTNKPKTSVYFHIRDIPLNASRAATLRQASGRRIREFALARKGKSVRAFNSFQSWNPDYALLVAHLSFDGEILRGRCAYNSRSRSLLDRVEALMRQLYTYPPKRYFNADTGVTRLHYFNVALAAFLQGKARELQESITAQPREVQREYLRAFFDDEGCMDFRPESKRRSVRGYQKDQRVLSRVQILLGEFDIQSAIQGPNEVVISGKRNLLNFQQEINFSSGIRVNGRRSNSRWQEDIEKTELLARAIASFRS